MVKEYSTQKIQEKMIFFRSRKSSLTISGIVHNKIQEQILNKIQE